MNTWPLLAQLYTVLTSKKYSIPVITHIQDIYPESLTQKLLFFGNFLNRILLPIDKLIAYNSRSLITISDSMKDLLVKTRKVLSSKIFVIYNWQNEARFTINIEDFPNINECFTYMFVGSLNSLANIESIIIAFNNANLNKSNLVIAGEGSEKKKLISFVEKNKIQNVKFLSFDSINVGLVQSKSDVLVLGLKKGASALAFPSKIPAYMFSSRPILAYVDVPSDIAKTIQIANCGWVVPSGNINELTRRFIEIRDMANSDLKILGGNGKKYAIEYLSRSTNLEKIISIIEGNVD
jgi:glycosyltransferase involved in cell wall biosynthesis